MKQFEIGDNLAFVLIILLVVAMVVLLNTSCTKEEQFVEEEYSFIIQNNSGFKSTNDTIYCSDKEPSYVKILLNQEEYSLPILKYNNNLITTEALKLPGFKTYHINECAVVYDNGTINTTDDIVLMATPHVGSEFSPYVGTPLPFSFNLGSFTQRVIPIEVVCYDKSSYQKFGFSTFQAKEVKIKEKFIYGTLCIDSLELYNNNIYQYQTNGIQYSMPAIFYVQVFGYNRFFNLWIMTGEYDNSEWFGENKPLIFNYGDVLGIQDSLRMDLYVLLVNSNGEMSYDFVHSWEFTDNNPLIEGNDYIVDFSLNGECTTQYDYLIFSDNE